LSSYRTWRQTKPDEQAAKGEELCGELSFSAASSSRFSWSRPWYVGVGAGGRTARHSGSKSRISN